MLKKWDWTRFKKSWQWKLSKFGTSQHLKATICIFEAKICLLLFSWSHSALFNRLHLTSSKLKLVDLDYLLHNKSLNFPENCDFGQFWSWTLKTDFGVNNLQFHQIRKALWTGQWYSLIFLNQNLVTSVLWSKDSNFSQLTALELLYF